MKIVQVTIRPKTFNDFTVLQNRLHYARFEFTAKYEIDWALRPEFTVTVDHYTFESEQRLDRTLACYGYSAIKTDITSTAPFNVSKHLKQVAA